VGADGTYTNRSRRSKGFGDQPKQYYKAEWEKTMNEVNK
jgi:hypothetical protein